jgi:hypothetical protein
MRTRRVLLAIAAFAVAWVVACVIIGFAYESRVTGRVTEQLGESLKADATIDSADLAMLRGALRMDRLAVRRDDAIGKLTLDVAEVRCQLPPLGGALFDRECRELAVRGAHLEASAAAVFQIKNPKRPPIHARHLTIDDAVFAFAPSAILPNIGRIEIHIDHAEAGATTFKTPLSWLFALETLRARIDLPAHVTVELAYDGGTLSAMGTLFGSTPVSIPLALPEPRGDAHDEVRDLVSLGSDAATRLVAKRAEDWLRTKLSN